LKGSVPTGNFVEPRLTSGAFDFLESIAENPPRQENPKLRIIRRATSQKA
jgi:hypothetical protein